MIQWLIHNTKDTCLHQPAESATELIFFSDKRFKLLMLIEISTASFNVMDFFCPEQGCVGYIYFIY